MGKTAASETHIAIFQLHVDFRLVEDGVENVGGADGHGDVILVVTVQQRGLVRRGEGVVRAGGKVFPGERVVLFAGGVCPGGGRGGTVGGRGGPRDRGA